jgi:hypothetical protein
MIGDILPTTRYIDISTLYIGHIGDSNVHMSPLFSVKDDKIHKFAINESAFVVILKSKTHVALYDINEGHLERKCQPTSVGDEIAPIKDGFVIYDNKRCIKFTRIQDACLPHKYVEEEISFEQDNSEQIKYFICSQIMYRYYRKDYKENFIFECIPFQTLVSRKTEESMAWQQLSLPKEAALQMYVQVTLSKKSVLKYLFQNTCSVITSNAHIARHHQERLPVDIHTIRMITTMTTHRRMTIFTFHHTVIQTTTMSMIKI